MFRGWIDNIAQERNGEGGRSFGTFKFCREDCLSIMCYNRQAERGDDLR